MDRIGYRRAVVAAHGFAAAGLLLLPVLPELLPSPFAGLLLAVTVYAIGGGLIEVLISPIMEACPSPDKPAAMSLLHSFYCWGHVAVVLLSSLFFACFGMEHWKWLAACWALLPLMNGLFFTQVPIATLLPQKETGMSFRQLLSSRMFWIMVLLMICAGASEQAVSQWASALAEQGLGVSKAIGDLTGPMLFAVCMGLSRMLYSHFAARLTPDRAMLAGGLLCCASYLLIALSPDPAIALMGCGICGFSVGVFWPGTFSIASGAIRGGGTGMFALLALAGDLGCAGGPTLVGRIAALCHNRIQSGILAALCFPLLLLFGIMLLRSGRKNHI
ncbi:MFS transporter [Ruminococcus sp.]|uniref:MFS transporter n=1 Tax=Ruminococcus sp. TaxID=41978 RepID=UPI003F0C37B7